MKNELNSTRRRFLSLTVTGTVGVALMVACGAPAATPAATAKPAEAPPKAPEAPKATAAPLSTPSGAGQALVAKVQTTVPSSSALPKPAIKMAGDLTVWHDWGNVNGGGLGMIDQYEDFQKQYPDVKITNVFDATPQKYLAAIASGNVPDLQKLDSSEVPTLGQRGVLVPLDDLIKRDNYDMTQLFETAVDMGLWGGKTYAISHHFGIRCLFQAQEIFKEVGLDPEKGASSWSDLLAWGTKMTKKEGQRYTRYGLVPTWTAGAWPIQLLQANGARMISEDGRKVAFNSDAGIEALDWALKATDEVCGGRDNTVQFQESNKTDGGSTPEWIFAQNKLGMVLGGNYFWAAISILNPTMKVKNATFPGGPSQAGKEFVFSSGSLFAILKGAKHLDMGWEFLKYTGSEQGGNIAQDRTTDVPSNKKSANSAAYMERIAGRKQVIPLFAKANGLAYVKSPISTQFNVEILRMVNRVLMKQMPVKQAVEEATKAVQKALDDFWATQK